MLLFLCILLLLLLMLHISLYHFFVYSNRAYKIPPCPEMISPIWLLFHFRVIFEHLDSKLPFQYAHQFRNRYLWRYGYNNMNVVYLYAHLLYLAILPFTQHSNIFLHQCFNLSSQYSKSIFRNPYNVIFTFIDNMRKLSIFAHDTNIGKAIKTLPPSKTVGF